MKLMNRPDVQLNNIISRNTQKNSFIQCMCGTYNACADPENPPIPSRSTHAMIFMVLTTTKLL